MPDRLPAFQDWWTWEFLDPGHEPDVSIVICAYRHLEVTLRCLRAIDAAQHANLARAEVIVVDDGSGDGSADALARVRGIHLLRLAENLGFLRAANAGIERARGRHVLLLNNDTEPVGCWLDPLLETLERRPRCQIVGARLVYPDGTLQEAGGIIFSDASGWNFGRGGSADDPRATYERQVDYVSGAALLARGDFIRQRGGFDLRYQPAYYEDTDLCFAARAAGGEVWYQPASIVVHHEGASHGTDESSGVKTHQHINREVFARRWAEELQAQMPPDAASVARARRRSARGRILVIDNEVPTPDRDSGSVRLTAVMSAMLDLGHAVTFLPLNGWRRQPYTRRLERLGFEVLGQPEQWWSELMQAPPEVVWISRPHVADALLDRARESFPEAAIIYDTVDLHFLRTERWGETAVDPQLHRAALARQIQELNLIERSDLAVVVSPHERDLLSGRTAVPVHLVPNVHVPHEHPVGPVGRSGLLFVGGFRHEPNPDAVEWFAAEVLPLIHQQLPETRLTIAGPDPTPSVLALAGEHVDVVGWVPDLVPLYEMTRLAIAPLRFGAGVKGKVGEALSLGVPMAMTSIAAEGMHIEPGVHSVVADTPALLAEGICRLLLDDAEWLRMSAAGRALVEENFGVGNTTALVAATLEAAVAAFRRGAGEWAS